MFTAPDGTIEYGACPFCGAPGWMFFCGECYDGARLVDALWQDMT